MAASSNICAMYWASARTRCSRFAARCSNRRRAGVRISRWGCQNEITSQATPMFNSASRLQVGEHMTQVMKGVRVLEVAQFTFVPAAGAFLPDRGADVITAAQPKRRDPPPGLLTMAGIQVEQDR